MCRDAVDHLHPLARQPDDPLGVVDGRISRQTEDDDVAAFGIRVPVSLRIGNHDVAKHHARRHGGGRYGVGPRAELNIPKADFRQAADNHHRRQARNVDPPTIIPSQHVIHLADRKPHTIDPKSEGNQKGHAKHGEVHHRIGQPSPLVRGREIPTSEHSAQIESIPPGPADIEISGAAQHHEDQRGPPAPPFRFPDGP